MQIKPDKSAGANQAALTISGHFLADMLQHLLAVGGRDAALRILAQAGVPAEFLDQHDLRITRAQFVAAYKAVAAELDDEMHGLWSRPIRGGTLKYMMLSLLDAANLGIALNRLVHFWNLLLDDYRLQLRREPGRIGIVLEARNDKAVLKVLGHELLLKVVHGIASWLLDKEIELSVVEFAFPCPAHWADYAFLYPGPVSFDAPRSAIWLDATYGSASFRRTRVELWPFLRRAPEDWAFTTLNAGLLSSRVRQHLAAQPTPSGEIGEVASAFGLSVRTLTRRLEQEGRSFRGIRDDLRRDMAVQLLTQSRASVDSIATLVGFENTAAFCRAFRLWMQSSPGAYRNRGRTLCRETATDGSA